MTFLNPLVLLGLAAASIPLLLHLLNLRKLRTVQFSSLRFLKEIEKTQIRSLKLQQLLLLLLRTLIIVCAVLAFARPILQSSVPVVGGHVPTSVVILLDDSYSMDYSDERGLRFQQAKRAALGICEGLKDGDELAVLTSSMVGSRAKASFVRNIQMVREQVQRAETSPGTAKISDLLRQASALMPEALNFHREVYIITDAQFNAFGTSQDSAAIAPGDARVYLIPIGSNAKTNGQNLSVDTVAVTSAIFQKGSPVSVDARIRNTSAVDASGVVVRMMLNGTAVAQRSVDVPANSVRAVSLSAPVQAQGVVRGSVEIEGDAVAQDNKRWFAFHIPPAPNVVLVTSQLRSSFVRALYQVESAKGLFALRTASVSELGALDLDKTDVIMLTESVPVAQHRRLLEYVQRGGALVVFSPGDDADFSAFLQQLGLGAIAHASFAQSEPGGFAGTDKTHPLFAGVFSASLQKTIVESPKIFDAYPCTGGQPIITMARGSFLAENTVGEGRVLYCAVSPTLQASSFPLTGLFPVVVLRSIPYTRHREQSVKSVICGESAVMTLPQRLGDVSRVKIVDPLGGTTVRDLAMLPAGAVLDPGPLTVPGVTVIQSTENTENADITAVAANAPSEESRTEYYAPADALRRLNSMLPADKPATVLESTSRFRDIVARSQTGTELWRLFVILAIVFALAEMVVARRVAVASV
jgi:hypothetical protein